VTASPETRGKKTAWLWEPDLMRRVHREKALAAWGYAVLADPSDKEDLPDVVLVNGSLNPGGALQRVRNLRAAPRGSEVAVLGYCGHVEAEKRRAALEAGCDFVAAYSAVLNQLAGVIDRTQAAAQLRPDAS